MKTQASPFRFQVNHTKPAAEKHLQAARYNGGFLPVIVIFYFIGDSLAANSKQNGRKRFYHHNINLKIVILIRKYELAGHVNMVLSKPQCDFPHAGASRGKAFYPLDSFYAFHYCWYHKKPR